MDIFRNGQPKLPGYRKEVQCIRELFITTSQEKDIGSPGGYCTSSAGQMGCSKPLPIRLLCEAFIWNCEQGNLRDHCLLKNRKVPIFGGDFPGFGFDEWFLNAAVYPRIASEGVVTFVSWKGNSLNHWLALDIEYCTWANPRSEIMFSGDPGKEESGCCH